MDDLFTPDEMVCYRDAQEVEELVRYYLTHDGERKAIAKRARRRVLASHTWQTRLTSLLATMREIYGLKKVNSP